jgi:hypothetical protein
MIAFMSHANLDPVPAGILPARAAKTQLNQVAVVDGGRRMAIRRLVVL